jgi:hypothetical protein
VAVPSGTVGLGAVGVEVGVGVGVGVGVEVGVGVGFDVGGMRSSGGTEVVGPVGSSSAVAGGLVAGGLVAEPPSGLAVGPGSAATLGFAQTTTTVAIAATQVATSRRRFE